MLSDHSLSNTLTRIDLKWGIREIYKDNLNLSTIVGINSSWAIEYRNAMLCGKSAARAHLHLIASRELNIEPRWHHSTLKGCEGDTRIYSGSKVHTRREGCCIVRQSHT